MTALKVRMAGALKTARAGTSGATTGPSWLSAPPVSTTYLRGINTAGGEFTHTGAGLPGTLGTHYFYPQSPLLAFLKQRGHKLVRIPFRWERIQQTLGGPLDATKLAELKAAVQRAADAGLAVVLDMHNYARYIRLDDVEVKFGDAGLTSAHFADAWSRLVAEFANQPAVTGWGLMNEPNGLAAGVWKTYSQAAVTAIRATGDTRTVFVGGDLWSGAWRWAEANGAPWITDPADNVLYEAHYYFDDDHSGTYHDVTYAATQATAVADGYASLTARVIDDLSVFTDWLKQYGVRGFVGEIGWPNHESSAQWNAVGQAAYAVLNAAGVGATYWAAGEQLSDGGAGPYNQDAYARGTLTPQAQATVIEAAANRSTASASSRHILVDSDYSTDPDDAIALRLALAKHRADEVNLLAVVINSRPDTREPAQAVEAAMRYDRTVVPLGQYTGPGTANINGLGAMVTTIRGNYPYTTPPAGFPDAVRVIRAALVGKTGVTYASVGFLNNLAAALKSPADDISPLTGLQLFAKAVDRVVIMGGHDAPASGTETNLGADRAATAYVFANCPSPMEWHRTDIGGGLYTGSQNSSWPATDLLRRALEAHGFGATGQQSFDPMAVLSATFDNPTQALLTRVPATVAFDQSTGVATWTASPGSPHAYVTRVWEQRPQMAALIDPYLVPDPAWSA